MVESQVKQAYQLNQREIDKYLDIVTNLRTNLEVVELKLKQHMHRDTELKQLLSQKEK